MANIQGPLYPQNSNSNVTYVRDDDPTGTKPAMEIQQNQIRPTQKIEDLCEAKEYLKDFADALNNSYINPLETAFINIFDKIKGKVVELDNSKYKVWLDAYCKIRQEEQKEEIKNSMTTESRLIKQATDDLLDLILKNDLESLESNEREIMNKAYFLKELINLIKKETTQCSDSAMK